MEIGSWKYSGEIILLLVQTEIGSWKYSGEIILLLVQTILKLFLGVAAFVGVMVD